MYPEQESNLQDHALTSQATQPESEIFNIDNMLK